MRYAWRRRLATAHLCLSWLSLAAAIVSIFALATRPPAYGLESLALPAHVMKIAAIALLLSTCTVQLWIARGLRSHAESFAPHGWMPIFFSAAVLAVFGVVALRGASSRALLAGGDIVLALVGTITCLSLLLAAAGLFLGGEEHPAPDHRSRRRGNPFQQVVWLLHCVACLVLVAAVLIVELRPLPYVVPGDRELPPMNSYGL